MLEWLDLNQDAELAEFLLNIVKVNCQATEKIVRFLNDDKNNIKGVLKWFCKRLHLKICFFFVIVLSDTSSADNSVKKCLVEVFPLIFILFYQKNNWCKYLAELLG